MQNLLLRLGHFPE
ncbi:unnamed protein product, partial [Didymodactylos carnosus]